MEIIIDALSLRAVRLIQIGLNAILRLDANELYPYCREF